MSPCTAAPTSAKARAPRSCRCLLASPRFQVQDFAEFSKLGSLFKVPKEVGCWFVVESSRDCSAPGDKKQKKVKPEERRGSTDEAA